VTPAGLRRVEAECAGGAAAVMGQLPRLGYVEEATIFGNALHLLIDAAVSDDRLAGDIQRSAGRGVRLRAIDPSLEDVFVRLTSIQARPSADGGRRRAGGQA